MRIIIAIDIIDGKCVRLTRGDYSTRQVYFRDPLDAARLIEDNGLSYLHLVDLDGAKEKKVINHRILEKISAKTTLKTDYAGGLRTLDDLRIVFENGANQVTGGSIAAYNPEVFLSWLSVYGKEKIILGADSKDRRIAAGGWLENTGKDIIEFISEYEKQGIKYAVCTDIDKDGMLKGPSMDLYKEILAETGISLIASGGISSLSDIEALEKAGCEGAIIGKAVYEGRLTLEELGKLC